MSNRFNIEAFSAFLTIAFLFISLDCKSQNNRGPYINLGYITNLSKCDDCTQADRGGSIRLGYLTEGRFGFYAGYLWFKEYHADYIDYDDKGWGVMVGIDFRILRKDDFDWYLKGGIMSEKFISTYVNRTEAEPNISAKPPVWSGDLKLLLGESLCNYMILGPDGNQINTRLER